MKKIKVFVRIFFIMVLGVIGVSNVEADVTFQTCSDPYNINVSVYDKYTTWGGNASENNKSWKLWSGGRIVYCSEKGIGVTSAGGSYESYQSLDSTSNNLMARVLAYGYVGNNDELCSVARIGTQVVVHMAAKEIATSEKAWRSLTASQIASMFSGSYKTDIANYAYNLMQQVFTHGTTPSFAKNTSDEASSATDKIALKYDEATRSYTNTLTNTNKETQLSTWKIKSVPDKVSAKINGENLIITSKDDSVSTPISMSKTYKTGTKVYIRTVGQNTVYATGTENKEKVVYVGYTYEAIGKGIIKIHKIDKRTSGNIKGIKFGIYSDDGCTKTAVDYLGNELSAKTTDKNGFVSWDNLYYPLKLGESRTYYVKELSTLEGYALDNAQLEQLNAKGTCIPVKITASEKEGSTTKEVEAKEEVVQDIYNIPYGNVTIMKQDEETGKVIEGVEFKLLKNNTKKEPATDMDGKVVENAITDKNGIAEFKNIPYGDYILVEVKANDYYKVLEEPVEFTLDKENDALKYEAQGTEALPDDKSDSKDILIPLEKYRLGDPTNDGKIDAEDIKVVESIISGALEEKGLEFYASDVNLDNTVNETDKELMQKYLDGDTTAIPNALKEDDLPGQVQKRVSIVVTNKPIDMKVSKLELTKEKELKGAKIVIKNSKGEVFIKYTSTDKVKEFAIPVGDYTLIETVAPKGYQTLKTEVKFRVLSNGNLKLISAKSNMYKLVKSKEKNDTDLDHLKIYNNLKKISAPKTGSVIAISTIVFGIALVGAGSYIIYRRYKNS